VAAFRRTREGIELSVRLTPRAHVDNLDGIGGAGDGSEAVLARVRAPASDGEANAALTALVARTFGRPKSAVTIEGGAKRRVKRVAIAGDVETLAAIAAAMRKA
jgi:uncharacterized protein YggU (UPF0235/DUF167 family)